MGGRQHAGPCGRSAPPRRPGGPRARRPGGPAARFSSHESSDEPVRARSTVVSHHGNPDEWGCRFSPRGTSVGRRRCRSSLLPPPENQGRAGTAASVRAASGGRSWRSPEASGPWTDPGGLPRGRRGLWAVGRPRGPAAGSPGPLGRGPPAASVRGRCVQLSSPWARPPRGYRGRNRVHACCQRSGSHNVINPGACRPAGPAPCMAGLLRSLGLTSTDVVAALALAAGMGTIRTARSSGRGATDGGIAPGSDERRQRIEGRGRHPGTAMAAEAESGREEHDRERRGRAAGATAGGDRRGRQRRHDRRGTARERPAALRALVGPRRGGRWWAGSARGAAARAGSARGAAPRGNGPGATPVPPRALPQVALGRDHVLEVLDPAHHPCQLADRRDLQGRGHDRGVILADVHRRGQDVDLVLGHDLGDVVE